MFSQAARSFESPRSGYTPRAASWRMRTYVLPRVRGLPGLGAEGGGHGHSLYPIRCALPVVSHHPGCAMWADPHGHKAKPGAARNGTFAPPLRLGESILHT